MTLALATTSQPPAGLRGPGKLVTGRRLESGRYLITVATRAGRHVSLDFASPDEAWRAVPEMWALLQAHTAEPKAEAA